MNNCGFVGRMGANPRYNPPTNQNGTNSVFSFSLAVKRPGAKKDAQGNMPTDWLNFTAFGKTADLLNQYCPKGCLVGIDKCHAIVDEYQDKNGNTQKPVKFMVDSIDLEVTFASTKGQNNGNGGQQQGQQGGNNNYQNNNNGGYNNNQNYNQGNQNQNYNNGGNYNNNGNNNGNYNNNQGYTPAPVQNNAPANNGNAFGQGRAGAPPNVTPYVATNANGDPNVIVGADLPF